MTVREDLSRRTGADIFISDTVKFLGRVIFSMLPEQPVSISKGEATPSVLNRTRIRFANTSSQAVSNLLYGQEGQSVKILGDGFTTLTYGVNIKTNTGISKLLSTNKVYTLTLFDTTWVDNE